MHTRFNDNIPMEGVSNCSERLRINFASSSPSISIRLFSLLAMVVLYAA